MDWFQVESSAPQNHKFQRLRRDLGLPLEHTLGLVVALWCWCAAGRETGDLSGLSDQDIDFTVHYDGFAQAARRAGFIDGEEGSSRLHEWFERQPLARRRAKDAAYRHGDERPRDDHATTSPRNATEPRREEKRREEKRKDKSLRKPRATAPAQPSPGAPVFDLPCKGGWTYHVTDWEVAQWSTAYPGIDIMGELRKMLAWLTANPGRVKTTRGMPRFVVAWLGRAEPSAVNGSPPAVADQSKAARAERVAKMNAFLAAHPQILDTRRPEEKIP